MATRQDIIKQLELQLEEQRRDNNFVIRSYEEVSVKNISFLAASLAFLGFLYGSSNGHTLKQKLFIPNQAYGEILYFIAAGLFLYGLTCLFLALQPRIWSTAFEEERANDAWRDYIEYLEYIKNRYINISHVNNRAYGKKHGLVHQAFKPLICGGIILVVIRIFGS